MFRLVVVLLTAPGLAGCGVMFGGTREAIQVQSAPQAATVATTPGTGTYTTPTTLSLERKNDYTLRFTRAGYREATFDIHHSLRGGMVALDILFTGLIGVVIDAATGGWFKLEPKSATVTLERLAAGAGPERIKVGIHQQGEGLLVEASEPGVTVSVERREDR